jgi:hypothetical protein
MFDLIGDVHGHAEELAALLGTLGYRRERGVFRHPERRAVFVGDLIDRGPAIREAVRLARDMVEAGAALAVLGNHEINALAFHTRDPDAPGEHLRRRTPANVALHATTLEQVPAGELAGHLEWMRTLPLWLELDGLRVVHACWDPPALAVTQEAIVRHGGISDTFLVEAHDSETLLYAALEILVKGKEMALPAGASFVDRHGVRRTRARVRWFDDPAGHTQATYALPAFEGIPATRLPARAAAEARPYPRTAPPVFFGHYWLADPAPAPLAANVACLDYSVARGGFLCAYRFDGEAALSRERFARTPTRQAESVP